MHDEGDDDFELEKETHSYTYSAKERGFFFLHFFQRSVQTDLEETCFGKNGHNEV